MNALYTTTYIALYLQKIVLIYLPIKITVSIILSNSLYSFKNIFVLLKKKKLNYLKFKKKNDESFLYKMEQFRSNN